ncbi:hypothetical protein HMPREF9302_10945 [Prevotella amnii DNF00058]|uniref:Uncharacterized protein n=2 Tax=Prevotella amnii TaxID=419005 RepID=A0A096CVR8_9BACT|nr:hypothetical protein HMPREF9302_10945 [Prevotella amnii DNF00058]
MIPYSQIDWLNGNLGEISIKIFASLYRKNFLSTIPISDALKPLIFSLKDSAAALDDLMK